ncbi:MAG: hypothetical protein M1821_008415 [Bathelium mastoideum]|nr:MAG: hypothetical protein M1821_008415 [Bathelium mastoideum]
MSHGLHGQTKIKIPPTNQQTLNTNKGTVHSTISKDETGDAREKEYRLLARFDHKVQQGDVQAQDIALASYLLPQDQDLSYTYQVQDPSPNSEEEIRKAKRPSVFGDESRPGDVQAEHGPWPAYPYSIRREKPAAPPLDFSVFTHLKPTYSQSESPVLQDYQMQLILQEQRNKKRRQPANQDMDLANTARAATMLPTIEPRMGTLYKKTGPRESRWKQAQPVATDTLQHRSMFNSPKAEPQMLQPGNNNFSRSTTKTVSPDELISHQTESKSVFRQQNASRRSFIPKRIMSPPLEKTVENSESSLLTARYHTLTPRFSSMKAELSSASGVITSMQPAFGSRSNLPQYTQSASSAQRRERALSGFIECHSTSKRVTSGRSRNSKTIQEHRKQLDNLAMEMTNQPHVVNKTRDPLGGNLNNSAAKPPKQAFPRTSTRLLPNGQSSEAGPSQGSRQASYSSPGFANVVKIDEVSQISGSLTPPTSNIAVVNKDVLKLERTEFSPDTPVQALKTTNKNHVTLIRDPVPIDGLARPNYQCEVDQDRSDAAMISEQSANAVLRPMSTSATIDIECVFEGAVEYGTSSGFANAEDEASELAQSINNDLEIQSPGSESYVQKTFTPRNPREYQYLEEAQGLRAQIAKLQKQVADLSVSDDLKKEKCTPWLQLHRVHCHKIDRPATYVDAPIWVQDDDHYHLDGRRRISDEEEWISRQEKRPFVVFLEYFCKGNEQDSLSKKDRRRNRREPGYLKAFDDGGEQDRLFSAAQPLSEELHILSDDLKEAVSDMFDSNSDLAIYRPSDFEEEGCLYAPYIFHYHFRHEIHDSKGLNANAQDCSEDFWLFQQYLEAQTETSEREANDLFAQDIVTSKYLSYLFPPGELLVTSDNDGLFVVRQSCAILPSNDRYGSEPELNSGKNLMIPITKVEFDGEFRLKNESFALECPYEDEPYIRIQDLSIHPLKYAGGKVQDQLRMRGQFFYSCKNGKYVVGPGQNDDGLGSMDDEFILRLPATIQGFHMQDKKWVKLPVDKLESVDWNENAFNSLAIDKGTKELVEALVTNKIEADKGTDLVAGKGTGLIMLLHGGPGTGKTLTAESVAEIAKKPLFRVTCGDVGTNAKDVEEYLESVFQLGRTWGCVVLLDEADVFLEQRSSASLERNALVSVFLRVLEYYDGILLLTSNRVGTFDEAFRSRIQLALHYRSLDKSQRLQIWNNFIERLEFLKENVDVKDIRGQVSVLARPQMNGRQIRNVVTTARQLAKFRGERLGSTHLQRVIKVCKQFDDYLAEVKEATELEENQPKEEEWARDEGIR